MPTEIQYGAEAGGASGPAAGVEKQQNTTMEVREKKNQERGGGWWRMPGPPTGGSFKWLPGSLTPLPPASSSPPSIYLSLSYLSVLLHHPLFTGALFRLGSAARLALVLKESKGPVGVRLALVVGGFRYERTHIRTPTLGSMDLQKPTQVQLLMLFP